MIKNVAITEKLKQKTNGDKIMYDFITSLLENEAKGKNYKKYLDSEITNALEKRKGGEK